jgi:hypothetical protein
MRSRNRASPPPTLMRPARTILVVSLAWASAAHAECRDSAGGAYSFDTHLSLQAGHMCLIDVEVFAGPGCHPAERLWGDTRGCNETERLAVTDRGTLVSILAPATAHRDWAIVSLLAWRDERVVVTRLALEDLPGAAALRGVVRPVFDGAAIRFAADILVSFETLEALGE